MAENKHYCMYILKSQEKDQSAVAGGVSVELTGTRSKLDKGRLVLKTFKHANLPGKRSINDLST